MSGPATANYDARWGYREFDAERYERRRYGGLDQGLGNSGLGDHRHGLRRQE